MFQQRILVPFFISLLLFISFSCKDSPVDSKLPCGGIDPGIVPEPPYDSPIWHPSGKFIGFNHTPLKSITYPYGENCWGEQHFDRDSTGFWLINVDGTNMRRIFPYKLQNPAWSPDGQWIAFVLNAQIYKMKFTGTVFDTTTLTQLTFEGRNFFPSYSADGQWIVYDTNKENPNGGYRIWKMRNNGTEKSLVIEGRMPCWSNDQEWIFI